MTTTTKTSLPVRGAWIEISADRKKIRSGAGSLPVRGAWIEISFSPPFFWAGCVAPRAGSVD